MTFRVGDKIAHPLHGAGIIERLETRRVNGCDKDYYVLKLPGGDMVVMIPTDSCSEIGVRPIVDSVEIEKLFSAIPALDTDMTSNWNKRYRENMQRIRSGDMLEVASVIKCLMHRDLQRGLSTGERRMLHSAKRILLSEIVMANDASMEEAEARLDACML
jgi:CarD family transcriptional regulator